MFDLNFSFSRLMLGTAQFGMPYGIANQHGQPEYQEVLEILTLAYESGVNCLDTAATYGNSEEILGRALAELGIAGEMFIVTKVAAIPEASSTKQVRRWIRDSVWQSMLRLHLNTLPLCLLHREEDARHSEVLQELRVEGLIQNIGISVRTTSATASILDSGIARAIQLPANVLDHRFRRCGLLKQAADQRMALFIRSIYLQGLLLIPEAEIPEWLGPIVPVRRSLQALAHEAGLGLRELAARYILSLPEVTSVLVGLESVEQLRQNLAIFTKGNLDPGLVQAVEACVPALPDEVVLLNQHLRQDLIRQG